MSESSTHATSTHYSKQKQPSKKALYLTKNDSAKPDFPEFVKNELFRRSVMDVRERQAAVRASPEKLSQVKSKVVRNIMTRLKVQRKTLMDQIASVHDKEAT